MRIAVKHLLRKYGYPPDLAPQAVKTVVDQAERRQVMRVKNNKSVTTELRFCYT